MSAAVMEHGTSVQDLKENMSFLRETLTEYGKQTEDRMVSMTGVGIGYDSAGLKVYYHACPYRLSENALRQLCGYCELQPGFISRCLEVGMADLAAETLKRFLVRTLVTKGDWNMLFRLRYPDAKDPGSSVMPILRSVSTERYGVFDNVAALDLLMENLPKSWGEAVPLKTYGNADNLRGTLLFPDTLREVIDDSEYYLGLYYRNSEIGCGAFGVSPFLFRSYCTNTAIWGRRDAGAPDVKAIHLGDIQADRIREQLAGGLALAARNGPNLHRLMYYAGTYNLPTPQGVIGYVAHDRYWGPEVAGKWLEGFNTEPDPTARGIVNGLTRAAQEYQGEQRIAMETAAGEILAPSIVAGEIDVIRSWDSLRASGAAFARSKRFKKYFPNLTEADKN